jgi:hypothetical protein
MEEFKNNTRKDRSRKSYLAFKRFETIAFIKLRWGKARYYLEGTRKYKRTTSSDKRNVVQLLKKVRNEHKDDWGFPRKEILNSISKAEMKQALFEWHFAKEIFNDDERIREAIEWQNDRDSASWKAVR